ncbi:hypothetical protein KCP69_17800 [Salmonella enterica subsp. enterica]|nr:hypothetical protein KCP69_17800 [Salmonella enterica subsp. enterica]
MLKSHALRSISFISTASRLINNSHQDRQYPYGAELAHVLGYVSKINDNDLKALDKKRAGRELRGGP